MRSRSSVVPIGLLVSMLWIGSGASAPLDDPGQSFRTAGGTSSLTVAEQTDDCPEPPQPPNPPGPNAGIPPLPCIPTSTDIGNFVWDYGIGLDPVRSTVSRAKLDIRLPSTTLRAYTVICFGSGVMWFTPGCEDVAPDRGWSLPPSFDIFQGQAADAWVESPPGARFEFGTFPPVRVRTVAFGSIPVEATANITQTVTDGLVDPLRYQWMSSIRDLRAGTVIPGYEHLGPSPGTAGGGGVFAFPANVEGKVRIRLSDVVVDGVPVAVGRSCQTPPATMELRNPPGWFDDGAQNDGEIPPGEPGAWSGVRAGIGTQMGGTIDIPEFRGCGTGGENLDPLISAMISGPNNPVTVTNGTGLSRWCDDGLLVGESDCPPEDYENQAIAQPSAELKAVRRAAPAGIPESVRDQMTPAQIRDYKRFVREYPGAAAPLPDDN